MNLNRMMWAIVFFVVLATIVISVATPGGLSQGTAVMQTTPTPPPDQNGTWNSSKYAAADYDATEPSNIVERENRRLANQRYDGQS
ncbi:MAG: hypothetical protein ABIV21_04735, partial [Pyrinomonadaceae bacterium]